MKKLHRDGRDARGAIDKQHEKEALVSLSSAVNPHATNTLITAIKVLLEVALAVV